MTTQIDWVPDLDTFDSRLAAIRHQMGWNIKEAALACGVKPTSWREWELAGRVPRDYPDVCHQIAKLAGCNLVWLMTGITPPGPHGRTRGSLLPRMDSNHQPPVSESKSSRPRQFYTKPAAWAA